MLTSITPLGERGRANRWRTTVTAYVVSSVLAAALVGLVLGAVGSALPMSSTVALVVLGAACLLAAVVDATGHRPPSWHRQVDEAWMQTYRGWVYGAGYGGQLGAGVVTIVTSATVYAALVADLVVGSVWGGAVLGAVFGLARALPLVAARRVTTPARLASMHRAVALAAPRARWVAVAVAALVAIGALAGGIA